MPPFARQRAFRFALGLLFVNIPAAAISAAILRFPNSALFIRNSVFVAPLVLPLLAARVNNPPPYALNFRPPRMIELRYI